MTNPTDRAELADSMYRPILCGGMWWDENGQPVIVHGGKPRTPQEHDDFVRRANPTWSDEALRRIGALWCDEEGICRTYVRTP